MLKNIRQNVKLLGTLLGESIALEQGQHWVQKIETVRKSGKQIAAGDSKACAELQQTLSQADNSELTIYARAFNQFLNLANIAEQQYTVSPEGLKELDLPHPLAACVEKLDGVSAGQFNDALKKLHIELVLTAHPTEINRRTFIHKYHQIAEQLENHTNDSQRIRELGLTDLIGWHLDLPAAEIPQVIQAHHVMVLPYRESSKLKILGKLRGTSGALSWATACGRGVITSDARSFAEEVSHGNGEIYPQGNVQALTEVLARLCAEPQRARAWAEQAATLGRERVWSLTAERFQQLFQTACEVHE